jgi:hypothetical protein
VTTLDAVFRFGRRPDEGVLAALRSVNEVYGIRRIVFDEDAMTVRVEFDATRLTQIVVKQLLRRGGLDVLDEAAAEPPKDAADNVPASAPAVPVKS